VVCGDINIENFEVEMKVTIIYDGEDACERCLGWKKVDDGEKQSWKYWAELPEQSRLAVNMGLVKPIDCPDCGGTGIQPKPQNG